MNNLTLLAMLALHLATGLNVLYIVPAGVQESQRCPSKTATPQPTKATHESGDRAEELRNSMNFVSE